MQVTKLQALADLDKPSGETSRWVADWRAINRYALADLILAVTGVVALGYFFVPGLQTEAARWGLDTLLQMSASVFSFMFGDRVHLRLTNGRK